MKSAYPNTVVKTRINSPTHPSAKLHKETICETAPLPPPTATADGMPAHIKAEKYPKNTFIPAIPPQLIH